MDNKMGLTIYTAEDLEDSLAYGVQAEDGTVDVMLYAPDEAMIRCMDTYGKPDLPYLKRMTGCSREELIEKLELYQDPKVYDCYQDADRGWLTQEGYVKNKHIPKLYEEALQMHEKYGLFKRNLQLLKKYYPKACGITAHDLPMGNRTIPGWLYSEIFKKMFGLTVAPSVKYNNDTMRYTITFMEPPSYIVNYYEYGVTDKGATAIIAALMNGEELAIKERFTDPHTGKEKYVRNEQETLALLEKVKLVVSRYFEVLSELLVDADVYEKVSDRYVKTIGGYHIGVMEAGWISPPELKMEPYPHQKRGIAKITMQPATMLVWDTGAGKTLVMVAGAAELKRLGICRKILFVVPNGSFTNFVTEAEKYYPNANYLIIDPTSFSRRKEYYLGRIKNGSYDGIIMAFSSYNMLDMTKDYYLDQTGDEIHKVMTALSSVSSVEDKRILRKKLSALLKKQRGFLEMESKCTDCFDELGIDCLMIDEVQNYKNVSLDCGYSVIVGVSIKGSHKCDSNMEKVHYVLKGTESSEGRVVFATATPIKNSIAEQYIYQEYLQQDELRYLGMNSFREWMKNFTEAYTKPFIAQDIQHLKMRTKLKFHNLTDLHGMISSFVDFYHIENGKMNLPKCRGYQNVVVPATAEDESVYREIARKLCDVKDGVISLTEYNNLMATIEGRNTALDIRLTRPKVKPERGTTKEEFCAAKVKEYYARYPGKTQAIFCDTSVPKAAFNVYDELKKEMLLLGIPEKEIAFIHDAETPAKKKKLLREFNQGKIRILIGSTEKMGTGLNIQENLIALHHYDCPWSPAQLIQRNGRGIRVGNSNEEVFIFRYIKEKSYDAIMWQNVETKMHFITEYNSYTLPEAQRDAEDITDNVLSYGEAIAHALGNPKLKEHTELENEITRMKVAGRKRAVQLQQLQKIVTDISAEIEKRERYIETIEKDMAYYDQTRKTIPLDQRQVLGQQILDGIASARKNGNGASYRYQGFPIIVPLYNGDEKPYVRIKSNGTGSYKVAMETDTPLGCCKVLDYYLGHSLPRIKERHENKCDELAKELRHANIEILKGNGYVKKIYTLTERLKKLEEELEEGLEAKAS